MPGKASISDISEIAAKASSLVSTPPSANTTSPDRVWAKARGLSPLPVARMLPEALPTMGTSAFAAAASSPSATPFMAMVTSTPRPSSAGLSVAMPETLPP